MSQTLHVLTVQPRVPTVILDAVLTGVERMLHEAGATRVWIVPNPQHTLSVMAEMPCESAGTGRASAAR